MYNLCRHEMNQTWESQLHYPGFSLRKGEEGRRDDPFGVEKKALRVKCGRAGEPVRVPFVRLGEIGRRGRSP